MVEKLKEIFNPEKMRGKEDVKICSSALKISDEIGESPNTSSFLIALDSLQTGSSVFLIKEEDPSDKVRQISFVKA